MIRKCFRTVHGKICLGEVVAGQCEKCGGYTHGQLLDDHIEKLSVGDITPLEHMALVNRLGSSRIYEADSAELQQTMSKPHGLPWSEWEDCDGL